ncbi:hypothetical protein MKEN_00024100 [Mycena kentingensis (nom. inval.)]|nr:hypothetical protein MKEN_00024100 [Mycena kentingensis (nom. inval.)]
MRANDPGYESETGERIHPTCDDILNNRAVQTIVGELKPRYYSHVSEDFQKQWPPKHREPDSDSDTDSEISEVDAQKVEVMARMPLPKSKTGREIITPARLDNSADIAKVRSNKATSAKSRRSAFRLAPADSGGPTNKQKAALGALTGRYMSRSKRAACRKLWKDSDASGTPGTRPTDKELALAQRIGVALEVKPIGVIAAANNSLGDNLDNDTECMTERLDRLVAEFHKETQSGGKKTARSVKQEKKKLGTRSPKCARANSNTEMPTQARKSRSTPAPAASGSLQRRTKVPRAGASSKPASAPTAATIEEFLKNTLSLPATFIPTYLALFAKLGITDIERLHIFMDLKADMRRQLLGKHAEDAEALSDLEMIVLENALQAD